MSKNIKILIIGGGFGGIYALKNLAKKLKGQKNIELSLIAEKNYFIFTPLLHEVATGGINPQNIIEPIRKILGHCLKNFYLGKAEIINLKEQTVKIENTFISYDYLIIATGSKTNFYDIKGAEEYCFTLKSIDDALKIKNHCINQIERASKTINTLERQKILRFVIVGGGPTGVELVTELQEFLKENFSNYYNKEILKDISIILIEKNKELLSSFDKKLREKSLKVLLKKNIKVIFDKKIKEVNSSYLTLDDNINIYTENIIWVAGVTPIQLQFDTEIKKSTENRIIVNEYLQLENHKEVFAIGDIASFKQNDITLPKLAQVAKKQAEHVALNIKLLVNKKNMKKFKYKHSGDLISLGKWMAVGQIKKITFSGYIAWWIWRTIYLSKLISFRKKIEVAIDWTLNFFSSRDISQI